MKLSDIVNGLTGVLQSSSDKAAAIAKTALDATNQLKSGALTQSEYKEIIVDLQTEQLVRLEAEDLEQKEALYRLFVNISQAASILTAL